VASMPIAMEEINRLPSLSAGLFDRGHPASTVRKVLGENLLRVLEAAERVSSEMREEERTRRPQKPRS